MRNYFSILTIIFLGLGVSSVGQQDKHALNDTLLSNDQGTVTIYVTKENLQSKLDSIALARKEGLSKYKAQEKKIESKIDEKFKELNTPQKKNKAISPKKKRKLIEKSPIITEMEDDSIIEKKRWFKRLFIKEKNSKENVR